MNKDQIIRRIKDMIDETEGDIAHLIDVTGVAGIDNRGGIRHKAISYCKLHIKDLLELKDIIERQDINDVEEVDHEKQT